LNLNDAVVAARSSASILDAMKLMSEQGVSSIAVLEENSGTLLSAVSVTDIGKARSPLSF
jgi:CBS domain-containing protein